MVFKKSVCGSLIGVSASSLAGSHLGWPLNRTSSDRHEMSSLVYNFKMRILISWSVLTYL